MKGRVDTTRWLGPRPASSSRPRDCSVFRRQTASGDQPCTAQKVFGCLAQLPVIGGLRSSSRDENGIPSGLHIKKAHRFPQSSFDTIPYHGVANAFADLEPKATMVQPIIKNPDHQQTICGASALSVDLGVPFTSGETELPLHRLMPPVILSGDDAL